MYKALKSLLSLCQKMQKDASVAENEAKLVEALEKLDVDIESVQAGLQVMQKILAEKTQALPYYPPQLHSSSRVFSDIECMKLNKKNRSYLLSLEKIGVLTPATLELVLDQLMYIKAQDINLAKIKWVTLMVLLNQPDRAETACVERFFLSEERGAGH